ncbi:MAG: SpoIID/LytB domain-containing protein [Patescibacteria group bacterium]|nr:SpoIID/LytB domain-containing protein [Patescibacteria group bacterium]
MKSKTKIKYGRIKFREILFPAVFMIVIISLSAFGLRLIEEKIINKNEVQAQEEKPNSLQSASYNFRKGYLTNGQVLGLKTTSKDYQAELINKAYDSIRIYPGKSLTFWVDFKNTGSKTWHNSGENFIALNVSDPAGRQSLFQHEFWSEYYYRPGRLSNSEVKPGEVGRFTFALKAPEKPGNYSESFGLVAENLEWITGGKFDITIEVVPEYQAELVGAKASKIEIEKGESLTFWVDFKNRGTKTWYNTGENFIALNVAKPAGRESAFQHEFWSEYYYRPSRLMNNEVKPGQVGRFKFALQAPNETGQFTEHFGLVAENLEWITGGEITIPITVFDPNQIQAVETLSEEPNIRIGLYNTSEKVTIKANGAYYLKNSQGQVLDEINGTSSSVEFVKGQYIIKTPHLNQSTALYPIFVPKNNEIIMEITSFENRPAWDSSINDNKFRGDIEVRYSTASRKLWVINELPLESYLRGLGEASGTEHSEYLKALVTAARTYALYNLEVNTKHRDDNFTLDDSANDQVYRGYNMEIRSPGITEATQATAGQAVTYNNEIVVTPYFSRSDGRTRSWSEVWRGEKEWLVSKDDPHCEGMELWGHGVGLSGTGARGMAKNGSTWNQILKYYYTNVEITKIY